jgi:dGTP triphosphohydrolase
VSEYVKNTKQMNGKAQRRYFIGGDNTLKDATEIKTVGQMKTYLLGQIAELHAKLLDINYKSADIDKVTGETVARKTIMGQLDSLEKTLNSKCHVSKKSINSFESSVAKALVKKVNSKSKKSIDESETVIADKELKTILKDSTKEFEATQLKDVANALANVKGDKMTLEEFEKEFKFTTEEAETISSEFNKKTNIKSKTPPTPGSAFKAIVAISKDKKSSLNPACAIVKPATPANMLTSDNSTPANSSTPIQNRGNAFSMIPTPKTLN